MDLNYIYNMDCLLGMEKLENNSIDLVFTSPPYAEQRDGVYEGASSDGYLEWFSWIASQINRTLKDSGSFFLNIKEHSEEGFRSLYVFKLVIMLAEEYDLKLIDTLCWTKNGFPGKPRNKFKNGWEPIYHFAKNKDVKFRPERVMVDMKEETKKRLNRKHVGLSDNKSGFSQPNFDNLKDKKLSYPPNHLHIHNVLNQFSFNKWHPATYPKKLVEFFVKAYSDEGDTVLDPFMGSGVTAIVAKELNRNYIGFELSKEYCEAIEKTTDLKVKYV